MGRNWQLLGEVPDSDDEELDGQEPPADNEAEDDTTLDELNASQNARPSVDNVLHVLLSPRREAQLTRPSLFSHSRHSARSSQSRPRPRPSTPPRPFFLQDDSEDELNLIYDPFQGTERRPMGLASSTPQLGTYAPTQEDARDDIQPPTEGDTLPQQQTLSQHSQVTQEPREPRQSQNSQLSRRSRQSRTPHGSQTPKQTTRSEQLHEPSAPPVDPFSFSPASSLSSLSRSPSPLAGSPMLQDPIVQAEQRMSSPFPTLPDSPPNFRLGFVRSLRPRKPIQQHPYLLEGAQYAQAMKSHGVKPVRTEYNAGPRKQAVEEDSQDQDFQQEEESQLPMQQQRRASQSFEASLYDFPSSQAELGQGGLSSSTTSPRTSTPAQRFMPLSSQDAPENGTDNTSLPDEDDFPTPGTLQRQRYKRLQAMATKRQSSPKKSSAAKRARTVDTPLNHTAPAKWIPVPMGSSPDQVPRSAARSRPVPLRSPSPLARPSDQDVFMIADGDGSDDNAEEPVEVARDVASPARSETEESQSDSEAVRKNSKRIKGVLPASWLRLDQQKSTRAPADKMTATQRRLGHQNDKVPRKGVALPRQGQSTSSLAAPASLFDDSDDDNDNDNESVVDMGDRARSPQNKLSPLTNKTEGYTPRYHIIDDDDTGSVMEDNSIDRMAPGAKRNGSSNAGGPRSKKPRVRTASLFSGAASQKTRQPKITNAINRSVSLSTGEYQHAKKQRHSTHEQQSTHKKPSSSKKPRKRSSTPPLLSILDFVEPAAPDFICVAARTARRKPTLGKTSPSRKVINLGSRGDNVDALSVLQDWRAGKIKPKIPNPPRRPKQPRQQPPLQELSPNLAPAPSPRPSPMAGPSTSRKSQAQPFVNRVAQTKLGAPPPRPPNLRINMATRMGATMKPAQLETAARNRRDAAGFILKKKELDEMYRRRKRDAAPLPNVRLEQLIDDQASNFGSAADDIADDDFSFPPTSFISEQHLRQLVPDGQENYASTDADAPRARRQIRRFRKSYVPKEVDISALRFVCALDPIPLDIGSVTVDLAGDNIDLEAGKLRGLGPFGSQYSQHFDIFPLDSDISFHRSTLIGSGRLSLALGTFSSDNAEPTVLPNPTTFFQLDERALRWTSWDDVASSEFGILVDWLADALFSSTPHIGPVESKVHTLVNFFVDFIQTTVSAEASTPSVRKTFVLRNLEVIEAFLKRFEASSFQQSHAVIILGNSHLAALTGIVTIVTWLLQICRGTPECGTFMFQVEDLLQAASKLTAKALLKHGLDEIRGAYGDFQRSHRGIRRDKQAFCSWVVLIQVLEHAKIPRAGFWDVTYAAMLANKATNTCTDASQLERLWEDMFTLLPLGEFDSSGTLRSGTRHVMPLDGWELPKKALERVFQLYKANPHQSPSFNAYCRAVVGRCHYLVQEWGWRRCKTIVGTIFDFYGSQDFAHLRNEEAHRSPRYLEELASSPSLAIDSDDKCFHIFIKMLGLIILELKRLRQSKEMVNLVSRILPNHDRQYLKEKDVHERDLAALRNHHDLLCTLYWASSPDIRPQIHQIEKLVVPANSHKEACLINIRAWNQLARFVIATDEGYEVYKGFSSWMKNIFQQMLDQYLSAETDMDRQFKNLSTSMMQGISPDMIKAMAAANRAAAMDVLHSCVVASLDVLRHSKSLAVATYCLNGDQLSAVFTKMALPSPKANWSILSTALDVLDYYMDRLDKSIDEQYSSSAEAEDAQVADDAVLMLDHKLAKDFFRFSNTITHMSWEDLPQAAAEAHAACTERCVVVAARLASRFIHSGVYGLSRFFGSGDYCIFERLPHAPGLIQRKFLPLFVSAVVRNNVFDFRDLGSSILELWMLAIVKPRRFLAYEHRLAEALKHHDLPYVRRAYIPGNNQPPNYETNRAFFNCAMTSLRQQLRDAESATRRQQLRGDFARALKLVMQQMKEDLRYAKTEPAEHEKYIVFVRGIVALIRSHGSDICPLDNFFYDQSQDFSPSPEDPQLRAASIVMYGLRLGEGEATAAPQLFHYLQNNFNIALANDKLNQECRFLERSMENNNVLGFVLEQMLPAILRATSETEEAWPLLDVYCSAMERLVTRSPVPKDIGDENVTGGVVGLLEDIVAWLQWSAVALAADAVRAGAVAGDAAGDAASEAAGDAVLGGGGDTRPTIFCVRVHTMARLAALANLLQPFLMTCSCLPSPSTAQARLDGAIAGFCRFVESALADLRPPPSGNRRRYARSDNSATEDSDVGHQPAQSTFFAFFASFGEAEPSSTVSSTMQGGNLAGPRYSDSTTSTTTTAASRRYMGGNFGSSNRARVDEFGKKIAQNVRDYWVVNAGSITVRNSIRPGIGDATASAASSGLPTASTGVPFGPWAMEDLLGELQRQLRLWKLRPASAYGMGRRSRRLFPGRLRER